jgi:hypothetical protein
MQDLGSNFSKFSSDPQIVCLITQNYLGQKNEMGKYRAKRFFVQHIGWLNL